VLARTEDQLAQLGLTRQKSHYCRELAGAVTSGRLDLPSLRDATVEHVHQELTAVKGIGRWTADIYLLSALRHPDVWPRGDLALYHMLREIKRIDGPTDRLDELADAWRPWRAVAARIHWHRYLCARRR
jgi:DNA-3-methyladenine glycosylase II